MTTRKGTPHANAYVYPTRAHPDGPRLIQPAVTRATALVSIVREEDANAVARILDGLSWEQIAAVVVVLAAMVPDDQSVADLTSWVGTHPDLRVVS